ncbi:hypothetical protein TEA_008577 [Camellia sinensis var. sinensis]|uniref:PGG domain-containing protein n=2 Tax=Camellia sinensis TaxID=4442 RepID=A0A4S4EI85_CAMSN|nr:hypothetical protein TEA_008577 [Camellia sinensis var. sinensis]
MKEREQKSIKIMEFILREFKRYNYTSTGCKPSSDSKSDDVFNINQIWYESLDNEEKKETPILVASKNGITEIVRGILEQFSEAIYDVNSEGKNVMLLAVEHRQPQVYGTLLKHVEKSTKDLLYHNDNDGNNALHLAAIANTYRSWFASNAVLQMQWEINWFELVKKDMPKNMLTHQKKEGKTPEQSFMETHTDLMRNDVDWLLKTSDSCTIVAALIATVAFAMSAALPGDVQGKNGEPVLQGQGMFEIFAISSLVALCFSLMAVIMFLSILTSRHQVMDFHVRVPLKLLIGLTALFISIASMLISFCGGHFFVVRNILNNAKIAEYLVAFLPVTFFVIAQCPLYYKLFKATILKTDP